MPQTVRAEACVLKRGALGWADGGPHEGWNSVATRCRPGCQHSARGQRASQGGRCASLSPIYMRGLRPMQDPFTPNDGPKAPIMSWVCK